MSGRPTREELFIDGPAGRLETIVETPAGGALAGAAVVCHPHPLHGGTMHNKVAHTLARAFNDSGMAAVRFNYRGAGASDGAYADGIGEMADALAVIDWTQSRFSVPAVWLGGFSFGAAVSARGSLIAKPVGLVSIAPPVNRFADEMTSQPDCPWLIVHGDEDELVSVDETVEWANSLEPGPELVVMSGADHFFHGRLVELREHVVSFISRSGTGVSGADR